MIYPLDKRNTKKLKKQKQNQLIFFKHLYLCQIFSKKARIRLSVFIKNSINSNIIFGFSICFYVSVDPMDRSVVT